jgi:hypothetical protein
MYRKQNSFLLFMLLGLTAFTWLVYNYRTDTGVTDKNLFKVDDLSVVDRVRLINQKDTIEITFDGAHWRVNGRPADPDMIQVLMATLAQAEPRRPVAKLERDSIARALTQHGITVTLFAGTQPLQSFFAGGNRQKTQAYFMRNGETTPYAVIIPGYRVYVSGIFEAGETDWLDKRIFNFNWRNFKSLKAEFPNPSDDFEVSFDGRIFSIAGLKTDTAKLNTFLDQVSLLEADRLVQSITLRDSLAALLPAIKVQVATLAGEVMTLSIYTRPGSATVYGLTGLEPVAVFGQQKVSSIVQRRSWFEQK